jgi:putative DNA primase/helicase
MTNTHRYINILNTLSKDWSSYSIGDRDGQSEQNLLTPNSLWSSIITREFNDHNAEDKYLAIYSQYLSLEQVGSNEWKATCPFHDDHEPSFFINSNTGQYYCFGCEASGDVFKFLQEYLGISFPEACDIASKYGIEPLQKPKEDWRPKEPKPTKGEIKKIIGAVEGKVFEFRDSDLHNAERFVEKYRGKVLWCNDWKSWLIFKGGRWVKDRSVEIKKLAKEVILDFYRQASKMKEEDTERKQLVKHALKSETDRAINSMLELAKSELAILPEDFDRDIYILNFRNGTLNLKTMEFWAHRPEDYITKRMNVEYNPKATCPKWLGFLDKIFDHDQELIDFVQKAVGYSLSGDTGEDCLFILYGIGQNGKTTFLKTLKVIWGDYAIDSPVEMLLYKDNNTIPNDIARLSGARLVMTIEAPEGRRLNEPLIKKLTGRDTVTARFLHQEYFEFDTTCKIWLATNHKPVVNENSKALWRRIRLIPFTVQISDEERIPSYEMILLEEKEGIVNWAIEGFQKWQKEGLGIPEVVKEATQEYKDEMDILAEFIEEKCVEVKEAKATTRALFDAYKKWCDDNKEKPMSNRTFGKRLEERGYKAIRIGEKRDRGWQGIGLKTEQSIDGDDKGRDGEHIYTF